jgi:hypothetical protein
MLRLLTFLSRPRLPKKAETFLFFRITRPEEFKGHLAQLAPLLTTAQDAQRMREDIYKKKEAGTLKGLVKLSAINVAFSARGLAKVKLTTLLRNVIFALTFYSSELRASPMTFSTMVNGKI